MSCEVLPDTSYGCKVSYQSVRFQRPKCPVSTTNLSGVTTKVSGLNRWRPELARVSRHLKTRVKTRLKTWLKIARGCDLDTDPKRHTMGKAANGQRLSRGDPCTPRGQSPRSPIRGYTPRALASGRRPWRHRRTPPARTAFGLCLLWLSGWGVNFKFSV